MRKYIDKVKEEFPDLTVQQICYRCPIVRCIGCDMTLNPLNAYTDGENIFCEGCAKEVDGTRDTKIDLRWRGLYQDCFTCRNFEPANIHDTNGLTSCVHSPGKTDKMCPYLFIAYPKARSIINPSSHLEYMCWRSK